MRRRPDVGLVLCGMSGHTDDGVWESVAGAHRAPRSRAAHLACVDDLDHDAFLTALQRSTLYLRTPITDGVASSVLESLALGVPVVACENGTRPTGVLTYTADDPEEMAAQIEHVIVNRAAGRRRDGHVRRARHAGRRGRAAHGAGLMVTRLLTLNTPLASKGSRVN